MAAMSDEQPHSDETPELEAVLNIGKVISREIDPFRPFSASDDVDRPFSVAADSLATGRTCVIGSSGSGKSYTVGVLCEELCKCSVPFVIIDIEGEYSGLKEKYDAIWIGDDEKSDLSWNNQKLDLKLLAKFAPDCPPLIFDISETDKAREKVALFLSSLYREVSERRRPYLVILEEADRFIPQVGDRLPIFDEIARRGRKRGLGLMLCTQRPSLVDKNSLSQCANQFIGKLVIKNDLQSVAQFFSGRGLPNQLTTLSAGEFYVMGLLCPEPVCVKIRERETTHGGMTPRLTPSSVRDSVQDILTAFNSTSPTSTVSTLSVNPEPVHETPSTAASSSSSQEYEQEEPQLNQVLSLPVLIEQNQVPDLIRLEKSHRLFGQKETIGQVDLRFRPIVEIGVTKRGGLFKKKFETQYFLLDGMTGRLFESSDRLSFRYGLEKLLGLDQSQVEILKILDADKDKSSPEIAHASGLTEDQIRKPLKELEDEKLVRSSKLGRFKVYRRNVDLPKIELTNEIPLQLSTLNLKQSSKPREIKVTENEVREIIKSLWEGADLESFRVFYYPLYRVVLSLGNEERTTFVDARTGKETDMQ